MALAQAEHSFFTPFHCDSHISYVFIMISTSICVSFFFYRDHSCPSVIFCDFFTFFYLFYYAYAI